MQSLQSAQARPLVGDSGGAHELEETAVIDSAPLPCVSYKRSKQRSDFVSSADYGVCSSKALKYFGYKLHTVVSLTGLILGFLLTPANCYDKQPVVELLDSFAQHLQRLLGDGAYNDAALQSYLHQYRSLQVLAPAKANQKPNAPRRRNSSSTACASSAKRSTPSCRNNCTCPSTMSKAPGPADQNCRQGHRS